MKELVALLVALALGVFAVSLPKPEAPGGPTFEGPEPPSVGASAVGSVWHCTWLESGDFGDAAFLMASVPPSDARVRLPSANPSEEPLEELISIAGPGSRVQNVSDLVRFGATPGSVEFDDGPAAVAGSVDSPVSLSGDKCVRAVPKVSYFPGGTTREGRDLVLRLFNPFPELAKVSVRGFSEFGAEPLPDLGNVVDVPARFWVNVDLSEVAPLLDDLQLIVESQEGLVIPAIALGSLDVGDDATWPGTRLADVWEFSLVFTEDLVPELVIANPSEVTVTVEVDAFGVLGPTPAVAFEAVEPESQLRIPLPDIGGQAFGIRVTASAPIAAVVLAESGVDLLEDDVALPDADPDALPPAFRSAATVGAEAPANRWLLPGAGSIGGSVQTMWLMNTGDVDATVTLVPLGVRSIVADKVVVPAGSLLRVRIPDDPAIASYLVESTSPISAAWSAVNAVGIAFFAGVEIGE